jgi:hypothetical protein
MRGIPAIVLVALLHSLAGGQVPHSICEVQAYDSQGLSPLDGERVTIRGAVTLPPGYLQPLYTSFFVQQGDCGVNVFCIQLLGLGLALGDSVEVEGEVAEYISGATAAGATTEIFVSDPDDIRLISSGHPEPLPTDMSNAAIQDEANEGRLLRATGVVSETNFDYSMYLSDGESTLHIYRAFNDSVAFHYYAPGETLRVAGVLQQYDRTPPYFGGYELVPRFQRDIENWQLNAVTGASWGRIKALYR